MDVIQSQEAAGRPLNPNQEPDLFREAAFLILQIVASSFRPVSLLQLSHILSLIDDPIAAHFTSVDDLSRFIKEVAGPILIIKSSGKVSVSKKTNREITQSGPDEWMDDDQLIYKQLMYEVYGNLPKAHGLRAVYCIRSLLLKKYTLENSDIHINDDDHGFFAYADELLAQHLFLSSPEFAKPLVKHVSEFLRSEQSMFWIAYCLQTSKALLTTLGRLMVIEFKFKFWYKQANRPEDVPLMILNLIQHLYHRWHARLETALPYTDPSLLQSSYIEGQILFAEGDYRIASIYNHAITVAKECLEEDHLITLRLVGGLARLRATEFRWIEAIDLARAALQGQQKKLGTKDLETLGGLDLL